MIVVGLDTASNRWHAAQEHAGEALYFKEHKVSEKLPADVRRVALCQTFTHYLDELCAVSLLKNEPVHIFCEEPLVIGGNGKTTRLLSLAAGALWGQHVRYDVFWHWVDVATWQSYVGATGKSEARKAHARMWLMTGHGAADDLDEDHYDAGCIAKYGANWLLDASVQPADTRS